MTIDVSDNNPRINYSIAEGVTQTVFSVPFEFFEDSNVYIYVDGVLKTEGLDYTLTGGDGSTGTLTFVTATPPDVQQVTGATGGTVVTLVRHVSLERVTDFVAGQDINRAALNEQLDTIVAQIADLDDRVDRTIHLNDSEVAPSMLLTDDRKGRVMAFNSSTGAVEAGPLSNDIATIADNIAEILAADDEAAAAAASATAAATSASAASTSATDAQTAQTAAELAQTNAETAEANTEAAEANTAASAAAALASETAAASSASSASTSASSAASSASSASASADAALSALDSFDDRYLGQKGSDPALDNDGDALVAGALYFNTTDEIMKVFDGSLWVAAYASLSGAMFGANNLSDVSSASDSRANLGLATVASSGDYTDLINTPAPFDPNTLATVATTGSYSDLSGTPTLGTAAATASTDYATAAQGALADSAVQPNDSPTFGNITASGTGPIITISETDTSANHRIIATGGALFIQAEDSDGTTDGDMYLTGMNAQDLNKLEIKSADTSLTGKLTLPTNQYHYSSDGKPRLYYVDNGDTIFRTADDFQFRNNANATVAQIQDTGAISTISTVTATSFIGDGSGLTGLPAGYTNSDVDTHLNTGTATTDQVLSWNGTDYDWIDAGGGSTTAGDVGTYAFLISASTSDFTFGSTLAGSSLRPSGVTTVSGSSSVTIANLSAGYVSTQNTTQAGTWRCMGRADYTQSSGRSPSYFRPATLWIRIS